MQRKFFITATLIGTIMLIGFMSSFKTAENQQKEYMTIVSNMPAREIYVSHSEKDFQTIELEKKVHGFDFKAVLQVIKKYESEGWEVESNTLSQSSSPFTSVNYFYLIKEIK
jgi:uncharacterized protein (UPF0335 family)